MGSFISLAFVYILGGLTFLPLLLIAVLIHAHFTFPYVDPEPSNRPSLLRDGDESGVVSTTASPELEEKYPSSSQDNEAREGYFAVCREYVPGGVNGKPPERTTPVGSTVVSSPSPSVYQSMYRSIFDRKSGPSPIENKTAGKPQNKGGNIFYVVLRHCHLLLYDDDGMIEVRYVISLAHHDVSIYCGQGDEVPEGELFIKRNALCLTRKSDAGDMAADGTVSKPFYLFSENLSDKEDFYFAMLKNQDRHADALHNPPIPLQFEVKDIIDLVQRLHSSEEHLQTRWINAIIGRLFLGLYKTKDAEKFIRAKITKKISRVKTPSFLSKIVLRSIELGNSAPYITNPRLKELNVDGDCIAEADVKYTGCFRLEVAATARIELGSRFKAREVDLVLAVVVKKIQGHMQLRIKPPPSNRLWYTFVQMPVVELSVEPIVSSRQITYTLITNQIESRIKEVIAESIVMPFWDDSPFFSTEGKKWRGGIFVDETTSHSPHNLEEVVAETGDVDEVEHMESETAPAENAYGDKDRSMSMPVLDASMPSSVLPRKGAKSAFNLGGKKSNASSTSVDTSRSADVDRPRALRHESISTAKSPVISTDATNADPFKPEHHDQGQAAAVMAAISARSHPVTPVGSPSKTSSLKEKSGSFSSRSSHELNPQLVASDDLDPEDGIPSTHNTPSESQSKRGSVAESDKYSESPTSISGSSSFINTGSSSNHKRQNTSSTIKSIESADSGSQSGTGPKKITLTSVANAAASAKRWGLNALAARNSGKEPHPEDNHHNQANQPMGRGRPLPPPGTPLPPPDKKTKTAPIPVPKRKPLQPPPTLPQTQTQGPPTLPKRPSGDSDKSQNSPLPQQRPSTPPILPKRRSHTQHESQDDPHDGIFVVAMPDSEPTTPLSEHKQMYLPPWVDDAEDEGDGHSPIVKRSSSVRKGAETSPPQSSPLRGVPGEESGVASASGKASPSSPPRLPRRRAPSRPMSGSPEEDHDQLPSWMAAQEEEARAKSILIDEDSGTMHQ